MVITILSTDLLLQHIGEKSEAISRDVRKSAYSELPLSRRVIEYKAQNKSKLKSYSSKWVTIEFTKILRFEFKEQPSSLLGTVFKYTTSLF